MNARMNIFGICICLIFTGNTFTQSRSSIGLHYSFPASSTIITFLNRDGAGSYEGRYMYHYGISYTQSR